MWNPANQVLATFAPDELVQASAEAMAGVDIPQVSSRFLTHIGLPAREVLLCRFTINEEMPRLEECARRLTRPAPPFPAARRFGTDGGRELCVVEPGGQVYAIDLEGGGEAIFVNTNIETFAGFLALYVEYGRQCRGCPEEQAAQVAREVENRMRELDVPAFETGECWWAAVTEQMKDGLL